MIRCAPAPSPHRAVPPCLFPRLAAAPTARLSPPPHAVLLGVVDMPTTKQTARKSDVPAPRSAVQKRHRRDLLQADVWAKIWARYGPAIQALRDLDSDVEPTGAQREYQICDLQLSLHMEVFARVPNAENGKLVNTWRRLQSEAEKKVREQA